MKKILLIFIAVLVLTACTPVEPIPDNPIYDEFAACLTNSGAKMYGTEWCSHCKAQKAAFGSSFSNINYIDCDLDKQECTDAGVTGYPTWIMADGEQLRGEQSMETLADKTACELPVTE